MSEDRSLMDTELEDSSKGLRAIDSDGLGAAAKVGVELEENGTTKAKRSVET